MKAAVLQGIREIAISRIPIPSINENEILVKVMASGICGTDSAVLRGELSSFRPVIMGHEYSGIVWKTGKNVSSVKKGDRVFQGGSWPCGCCEYCKLNEPEKCLNRNALGRTVNGSFAQYVKVPADRINVIPESVDFADAQSAYLVASGIKAIRRSGGDLHGKKVAVVGSGHAGLLIAQTAKQHYNAKVSLFGTREDRLQVGRGLGCLDSVINVNKMEDQYNDKYDMVIEAVGNSSAVNLAIQIAKPHGSVIIFGVAKEKALFPTYDVYYKQLNILGVRGAGKEHCREAALLIEKKIINIKSLITHTFPVEETSKAFDLIENKEKGTLRVIIAPND